MRWTQLAMDTALEMNEEEGPLQMTRVEPEDQCHMNMDKTN